MPSNPYYAYIELWIGDVNLTLLPPQHVQQFTHIRGIENKINKFIIVLFDDTALLVESKLMDGFMDINFQYGYSGGVTSPKYSGLVQQYDVDFTSAGAILTIEGVSSSGGSFSSPSSATYTGMRIDEIVRQIIEEEGWAEGIVTQCQSISDGINPNRTFERNNQNAQVFITNELAPLAASANGDMDFVFYLEDRDGVTYANFCPVTQAANSENSDTHNYQFSWGSGDRNSTVISFNPEYSGTLCLMQGGATVDSSTIDRLTNQMINLSFTNTDDPCRTTVGDKSNYDYAGATRYIGGSAHSYDEQKRIAAYMWYTHQREKVNAELEILGDPRINAFDVVSMVMLNKDGLPHHSSGLYLIKEIEDDIVGGSFTTKMILFRNGMSIGVDENGGINVSIDRDYTIEGSPESSYTDPDQYVYDNSGSGLGYSKGSSNELTILNFCLQVLGLNIAAACGVLANIESESSFYPGATGDGGTSYGICQWHAGRWTNLKNFCNENGYDWKSIDGQLWYLKSELEGSESAVYSKLKSVANTAQGAYQAGYDWCVTFERPDNKYVVGQDRGANARDNYYPKYCNYVPPSLSSSTGGVVTGSGLGSTLNLHQLYFTNNNCYKANTKLNVKGVMVHSTGAENPYLKRYVGPDDGLLGENKNNNHWNTPQPGGRSVCVHGFIGKLKDESIATYQVLPWDIQSWHGYKGPNGCVNTTHIGFEICEDNLKDGEYFTKVYKEAVGLVTYLCKMYNLDPLADGVVICHSEGHARGIASNHGDVMHWFPKHGKNMDIFRADVAAALNGGFTTSSKTKTPTEGGSSYKSRSGAVMTKKNTISVPANVQNGLTGNYTNYTYFYSKWSNNTNQRTLADIWNTKGRTNKDGVATIDGHYLVAMTTKFGMPGDLVVVNLSNGTSFSAILGDSKGSGSDPATNEWGHYLSNGLVDIIEWEAFGTAASNTSGCSVQLGTKRGVKVSSVDIYGSWLNS